MVVAHTYEEWNEDEEHLYVTIRLPGLLPGNADVYASPLYAKVSCGVHICQLDLPQLADTDASTATVTRGEVKLRIAKAVRGSTWGTPTLATRKGTCAKCGAGGDDYVIVPSVSSSAAADTADSKLPAALRPLAAYTILPTSINSNDNGNGNDDDGIDDGAVHICIEASEVKVRREKSMEAERALEAERKQRAEAEKAAREKAAREAAWNAEKEERRIAEERRREEIEKAERALQEWKTSKKDETAPWDDVGGDSDDEGDFQRLKAAAAGGGGGGGSSNPTPSHPEDLERMVRDLALGEDGIGGKSGGRSLPDVPQRERVVACDDGDLEDRLEAQREREEREKREKESRVRAGEQAAARAAREAEARRRARELPPVRGTVGTGGGGGNGAVGGGGVGLVPIKVSFTKAVRDVPVREGKAQVDPTGLRAVEAPEPGADVADTDPAWLKDRADNFFRAGDLESAVSAYGKAIERMPQGHTLYANRAACHLKAGRPRECISDAAIAIGILGGVPETSADARDLEDAQRRMIAKLLVRRGAAHAELGELPNAIRDLEESLRLDPAREDVRGDLSTLVARMEASGKRDAGKKV